MRVLLTGASGFVGRSLSLRLRSEGYIVTALSRHVTTNNLWVAVESYNEIAAQLVGQDCVVHLAGMTYFKNKSRRDSLKDLRLANVNLTLDLARQAARAGVRRFVFISSVKVNGEETREGRLFTSADTPDPRDAYGISKMEAEQGLTDISNATAMEVVIIRPPLVYGPGVRGNFASLVRWVRSGIPLPFAAIKNKRSLVALDNLVDFITLCADQEKSPQAGNKVFLISDGEILSTSVILERIAIAYGAQLHLLPVTENLLRLIAHLLGQSGVANRLLGSLAVDSGEASSLLGWQPVVTMDEQIRKMAEHDACT